MIIEVYIKANGFKVYDEYQKSGIYMSHPTEFYIYENKKAFEKAFKEKYNIKRARFEYIKAF